MILLISVIFLSSILNGCAPTDCLSKTDNSASSVYNLSDSMQIIRTLIASNKIGSLLEDHDPEQLEILLNNFSPALMVFETEVLSCTLPVVVHFYQFSSNEYTIMQPILEKLAKQYIDVIKFVEIDVEKLFSIAQHVHIEYIPTYMFMSNREEVNRIEGICSQNTLIEKINSLIS